MADSRVEARVGRFGRGPGRRVRLGVAVVLVTGLALSGCAAGTGAVAGASGPTVSSAAADMLAFLPVLGAGEAIISGVDFPMPLSVIVEPPRIPPNSQTPTFKDILTYKVASGTVLNPSP